MLPFAQYPPHGLVFSPAQCALEPCGWPDVTCVQLPSEFGMLHALHGSVHEVLQQ
jgi:hypothetical protein